ncbi:CapA family protein [Haloactinomyces albus]|uniref:Poly-gamma-glutamate synthesis protein (Capsule biosynthesis protein) n=1 Tax=Haloactinomyces albus TaxID=1352928 RepID=A0AAE3ZIG0_9ACTN|nr:CapA family protein [Haloactinomyces albus]MDR7304250.1 poly-gamma-glutamate synthesis protein (capsule biosynthesis protein) [Haloactinomyces albus]
MSVSEALVTVLLCGDVMPGRGVDQILPRPGDPQLREPHISDARYYVRAAEEVSAPIARPVDFSWPWGDALGIIDGFAPAARVLNLESSVTRCDDFAPNKAVHYRVSPANLACVAAGRPDLCVLANNHVLDFGIRGLADTLDALSDAGLRYAGAGRDTAQASQPAVIPIGGGRLVVLACGATSSGIPPDWAATGHRAGVNVLPDLSEATAEGIIDRLRDVRRPGDIVIVSVHWGSNWGYHVPQDQVRFARRLIDGGVSVVHGHSSHHPRPIEVYRDRLILYGCGDLIDDYEGIAGEERYRDDLRLLYFPEVEPDSGRLVRLRSAVTQARRMRLHPASTADIRWMCSVLCRRGHSPGARVELDRDGTLLVEPEGPG